MVKIEYNNIIMTQGDSAIIKLNLVTKAGATGSGSASRARRRYTPDLEDKILFTVSRFYKDQLNYELLLKKEIPVQKSNPMNLLLILNPEDTKNIQEGIYNFQVELTHVDGRVDTCISGTFQLLGECE